MRLSTLIWGLCVLSGLACLAGAQTSKPDALDAVAGVHTAYYEVSGRTLAAIAKEIREKGPRDLDDRAHMAARTEWAIDWHWKTGASGKCDLSTATASFDAFVILPRLVGQVSPEIAKRWDAFLVKLRRHEANHARFAYEHLPQVVAALKAAPNCDAANPAAMAVLGTIRQHDLDYDASTAHGEKEGVVLN